VQCVPAGSREEVWGPAIGGSASASDAELDCGARGVDATDLPLSLTYSHKKVIQNSSVCL
jgi:hypothetical protein